MRTPLVYTASEIANWHVSEEYAPGRWRPARCCGFSGLASEIANWHVSEEYAPGRWRPARCCGFSGLRFLGHRFMYAWLVFTGQCDVLNWEAGSGESGLKYRDYTDPGWISATQMKPEPEKDRLHIDKLVPKDVLASIKVDQIAQIELSPKIPLATCAHPAHPAHPIPPVDRSARELANGSPETPDHREIDPSTGQQKGYIVLTAEERAKGFVRPVRRTYTHVGRMQKFENDQHPSGVTKNWEQRMGGCGTDTTMVLPIAETYARDPGFYGGTFCCHCRKHLPLNEFVWKGTTEQVGL
jgi:hypothetical protein